MAVVVDTGILYALADADDAWHERARAWVHQTTELLIVPVTVLPEVTYLLHTRLGPSAEIAFTESVAAGELDVEDVRRQDIVRCCELMRRYSDAGFVDASVIAIAERLKIHQIATTDRRHFLRIKARHGGPLALLP